MRTNRRQSARIAARKGEANCTEQQPEAAGGAHKRRAFQDISNAEGDSHRDVGGEKKVRTRGKSANRSNEAERNYEQLEHHKLEQPQRRRSLRILFKRPENYITELDNYQYTGEASEIDFGDEQHYASEYVEDVFASFYELEAASSARPYMDRQPDLNDTMRAIVVDWLMYIHMTFKMMAETLHLAVNIMDRFLGKRKIRRNRLFLVSLASLFIAAKYEETHRLSVDGLIEWGKVVDEEFSREDLLATEFEILNTLEYKVTIQTPHSFLIRCARAGKAHTKMTWLALMILESTLLSTTFLDFLPSQLAAAAIAIARVSLGLHRWSPTLLKYCHYSEEEVLPVAAVVLEHAEACLSSRLPASTLRKKFSSSSFGRAAGIELHLFY